MFLCPFPEGRKPHSCISVRLRSPLDLHVQMHITAGGPAADGAAAGSGLAGCRGAVGPALRGTDPAGLPLVASATCGLFVRCPISPWMPMKCPRTLLMAECPWPWCLGPARSLALTSMLWIWSSKEPSGLTNNTTAAPQRRQRPGAVCAVPKTPHPKGPLPFPRPGAFKLPG